MILYHGSNIAVEKPTIIKTIKGRDFGFAFYLTPIKEQAERMAIRKRKISLIKDKHSKAIVSVYEWDEDFTNLKYKVLPEANKEWLEMIIKCRSDSRYEHGYDIVVGKIADDSVGEIISYVQEGIMRKEDAINRLRFQKINSQIAFCSEKSLTKLKYIKSYEVTDV